MEDAAIRQRLATDERPVRRLVAAATLGRGGDADAAQCALRLNALRAQRTLSACAADVEAYVASRAELSASASSLLDEIAALETQLAEAQSLRVRLDAWDAVAAEILALPSVSESERQAAVLDAQAAGLLESEGAVRAMIERRLFEVRDLVSSIAAVSASAATEAGGP